MVLKDISEGGKPQYKVEKPEISWNTSSSNSLEDMGKDKIDAIKKAIIEINGLVKEREILSDGIFDDAQKEKRAIDNFILEVEGQNASGEIDDTRERIALRQKRVDLSELQLKERVNCWQDVARLKQELREKEQEVCERENRRDFISDILEDK